VGVGALSAKFAPTVGSTSKDLGGSFVRLHLSLACIVVVTMSPILWSRPCGIYAVGWNLIKNTIGACSKFKHL
jgi:hypothetical protein